MDKPAVTSNLSKLKAFFSPDEENASTSEDVTFYDITAAEDALASYILYTPCEKCDMSEWFDIDLYLKMDFLQKTGSYKDRGALFFLSKLKKNKIKKEVITASLGNHAKALAYHGQKLKIPIHVVLSTTTPIMKVAQCQRFNAHVIVEGSTREECDLHARHLAESNNWIYCDGYDDPKIIAANGTVGLEILSQVLTVDAVVVPVVNGGLLAGVALAIKTRNPKILMIGVEAEDHTVFSKAWLNKNEESAFAQSIAFKTARLLIDKMFVVNESWISLALLRLVEQEQCLVERVSALPFAAVLSGQLSFLKNKRVVLLLPSANVNTSTIGDVLEEGLIADSRLIKFVLKINDNFNALAELCQLLSTVGVSIRTISQEKSQIACVCETRDKEHSLELRTALQAQFGEDNFLS